MDFAVNTNLSIYYLLIFVIVILYCFIKFKFPLKIKKEKKFLLNDFKVTHIYGYSFSYGVGVDNNGNIFVPDFKTGLIYKIYSNLKKINIYKFQKNHLNELSFFEKLVATTNLKKVFKITSNIFKPHEIYFDDSENIYITQMGLGNCKGQGKISIFSKNNKLIREIGLNSRNNIGLIDPVMSYIDDQFLYISESGANKILRYKNYILFDWIGNDTDHYVDEFTSNQNLFFSVKLNKPHAIKLGPDGNYYIVDSSNHRILKFSKKGEFLGWIGKMKNGTINDNWKMSGESIPGKELGAFNTPIDLIFINDWIIISDCFNSRLVKVAFSGKSEGWLGDTLDLKEKKFIWKIGENPTPSKSPTGFYRPFGIKSHKDQLYIADKQNFRIKIINSKNLF